MQQSCPPLSAACGAVGPSPPPPTPICPSQRGRDGGGSHKAAFPPPAPPPSRCSLTFQHRSEGFLLSVGPLWPRGPPPPRRGHEGMALSVCGGSKGSSAPTTGPQRAQSSAGTANPRALLPKRCMGCSTGGGGVHCLHPTAQCSSAPLPRQTKLRSCSCAYSCEHRAAQCSTELRSVPCAAALRSCERERRTRGETLRSAPLPPEPRGAAAPAVTQLRCTRPRKGAQRPGRLGGLYLKSREVPKAARQHCAPRAAAVCGAAELSARLLQGSARLLQLTCWP